MTPAVFHILLALTDGPRHGYAIMQSVSATGGPGLPAGPGTVYGTLTRLAHRGLVAETADAAHAQTRRRVYVLTGKGRRALEDEAVRLLNLIGLLRSRGLVKPS